MEDEALDALVAEAHAGDSGCMNALLKRLRPDMKRRARASMYRHASRFFDADDIVQQVSAELTIELPKWRSALTFRAVTGWTNTSIDYRVVDAVRRHQRHAGESEFPTSVRDLLDSIPSEGPVTHAEQLQWLRRMIGTLREKYRVVMELHVLAGCPMPETAARLGIQEATARRRYQRAVKALQDRFGGAGADA